MPLSPVTFRSLLNRHGIVTPLSGGRYLVACSGPGRYLQALHVRRLARQFGFSLSRSLRVGPPADASVLVYFRRIGPAPAWPTWQPPAPAFAAEPATSYAPAPPPLIVADVRPYGGPYIAPSRLRETLFFVAAFAAASHPDLPLSWSLIAVPTLAQARRRAEDVAASITPARVASVLQAAFPPPLFPAAA